MPITVLSTLYIISHLILTTTLGLGGGVGGVKCVILIYMGKQKHRKVKKFSQVHTAR